MEGLTSEIDLDDPAAKAEFAAAFPRLNVCVRMVQDRITCYHDRGKVHGFVFSDPISQGAPVITYVKYPTESAQRFEVTAGKQLREKRQRQNSLVPMPRFNVTLRIDFGYGATEERVFRFGKYYDDVYLEEFCKEITEYGIYVYRHRFSFQRKKPIQE